MTTLPRLLRFHDLRGMTATLLTKAGVPLVVAQRILRHTDPRITSNINSHAKMDDMRNGSTKSGFRS